MLEFCKRTRIKENWTPRAMIMNRARCQAWSDEEGGVDWYELKVYIDALALLRKYCGVSLVCRYLIKAAFIN